MRWREEDGLRWLEADLGGARAAFSTRQGGASEPPFDSLNLGLLTDDDPGAVAENRRRLAAALGFGREQIAYGLQVHGAELQTASRAGQRPGFWPDSGQNQERSARRDELAKVDGQVLAESGAAGLVFVADCLPVALRGPGGVAILHCGWRGLAAGIVARGAAAVRARAAAIGPGIGPCCFEVGEEVAAAFAGLGEGVVVPPPRSGGGAGGVAVSARPHVDLPEVARRLLREAGVERVASAGLCTSCEADLFFSHRRDGGRSGRQAGLAWLEERPGAGPAAEVA